MLTHIPADDDRDTSHVTLAEKPHCHLKLTESLEGGGILGEPS